MKLLTIRYDPSKEPGMNPLHVTDFVPRNFNNIESKIINIIRNDLLLQYSKIKHISISLSGGIDSSLTLAMIRSVFPDVKIDCFTMGFGEKDDEINQAEEITRFYDCNFHKIIKDDILNELPQLIYIVKEPRWNLYQYYIMTAASKKSHILFSGDGGDELFAGYTFRYKKFLSHLHNNANWKEKARLYLSCHERDWVPDQDKIFGTKIKFLWEKIYKIFKPYFDNALSPLDQVLLADFNGKLLHDWLPTNNALGKFLDLDVESIFLTNKIIKFATHIPWRLKYNPQNNKGKIPLLSILKKQKGFNKIQPIKKGFTINLTSLWNKNARELVTKYINSDSEIVKNNIINEKWLQSTYAKLQENTDKPNLHYINKMLGILALEIWYNLFINKSMNRKQKL